MVEPLTAAQSEVDGDPLSAEWRRARLGDVATLASGGTPSKKRPDFWNGPIPWASPKDLKQPFLFDAEDHISEAGLEDGSRLVESGTLFLVVRGMILARDLPISMAMVPMAFNQDMKAIIPGPRVDGRYLLYAIQHHKPSLLPEIGTSAHGTRRISTSSVENFTFPLPPLGEQRTIAQTLDSVRLAKEATEKTVAAARQLKASLMRHLFTYGPVAVGEADRVALKETEVGPIPETWDVVSLGSVVEFLQYGTSSRCHSEAVGVPVLRIPNVIGDEIDTRELKYIEMGTAERKKYSLKAGDLLFVRTNGRREYIGRCAVFQDQPEEALFASYLIRARLRREHVLPEFMQMYSTMPAGRANLSGRASGAADGKYNINTQILKSVMLPKPSLEEQAEIVRAVKAVSQKEAVAKKSVDALEQLFQSTLKALMTGNPRLVDLQVPEGLGG